MAEDALIRRTSSLGSLALIRVEDRPMDRDNQRLDNIVPL